jgi:hypothetical protein
MVVAVKYLLQFDKSASCQLVNANCVDYFHFSVPAKTRFLVKDSITPTTITFRWASVIGDMDGFRLTYSAVGQNAETTIATVSDNDYRNYTLGQLQPSTEYNISVYTLSGTLQSEPFTNVFKTGMIYIFMHSAALCKVNLSPMCSRQV